MLGWLVFEGEGEGKKKGVYVFFLEVAADNRLSPAVLDQGGC